MVNNKLQAVVPGIFKAVTVLLFSMSFSNLSVAQANKSKQDAPDAFKTAKDYIAKKQFRKANRVLKTYHAAHPRDMNALWLQAQVQLYRNNNKQSNDLYQSAIKLEPNNDYLKLSYIHSLADMGKSGQAENMLYVMENGGSDYSDIALLHARLYYYQGNNKKAAAHVKKALQYDGNSTEANELNDQINIAKAPKISLTTSYLSDNQPLSVLMSGIRLEKSFHRALTLYIDGSDYHFMQSKVSDAPWIKAGNKMYFPKAGLRVNVGAGVMKFPIKDEVSWTGELSLNEKISQQFDVDLGVDRVPYFGTKSSVDTNISAMRFSAMLNWHKSNWLAQAAFINSTYRDNNNVYSAYAYFLAPIVVFPTGKLQMGLSSSYSGANENRYQPTRTVGEVLANYTPNPRIGGDYIPYFTPYDQYINAVLLSFGVNASKEVSININGDVGYGSTYNPYFFLDKNAAGSVFIAKGYSTEHFTPHSASFALNYKISKSWNLSGKYTYRSTYFFNSNYVTLGLDKSFLPHKTDAKGNSKSAFGRSIMDVEDKIQSLYRCKNETDLKQSVSSIRSQLVLLRDAQLKKKTMTEVAPGSQQALQLQDRYNSLNDMIADIDNVNLNDKEGKENKREWLTDKQFELTSIHYNGVFDEE